MKTCTFLAAGAPCGLRASAQIGVVLRPAILSYAIEVSLPHFTCSLHESMIDTAALLEAHLDGLIEATLAELNAEDRKMLTDLPIAKEACAVALYSIPPETPVVAIGVDMAKGPDYTVVETIDSEGNVSMETVMRDEE